MADTFENLNKAAFPGVGMYDTPIIQPLLDVPACEFIPFSIALKCRNKTDKGVHFFIDDYRFKRIWTQPDRYLEMLSGFEYVLSPDFSMYPDMPLSMQIYNHYRKHWLATYWQAHGIKVIPTICWADQSSFDWCFDGEPRHSTVAVSSVGCGVILEAKGGFRAGYEEMLRRLEPETILFYGSVPDGIADDDRIVHIEPYYKSVRKRAEAV